MGLEPPRESTRANAIKRTTATSDNSQALFETELRGVLLTGIVGRVHASRNCNVVESVFESLTTESANLTGCDFKDSAIRDCRFADTNFGSSSFAYNLVTRSSFERCSFSDTDVQHTEFDDSTFVDCDLRNLLVKGCSFINCKFLRCETNNKVFETCRFVNSTFQETQLQIESIFENFGIRVTEYEGLLRLGRSAENPRLVAAADLEAYAEQVDFPVYSLNVEYFLCSGLLQGSRHLDHSLKLRSWLPMFRIVGSFAVVLSKWIEFLISLYEQDQLTIQTLIACHSMTNGLLETLPDKATSHYAMASINGLHLSLARYVDEFLVLLDLALLVSGDEVLLLVEGDKTRAYYYRELKPLFSRSNGQITRLVRHNSPWDLGVSFGSSHGALLFMALFLATRTRVELSRVSQTANSQTKRLAKSSSLTIPSRSKGMKSKTLPEPVLALEFGGAPAFRGAPHFRIKAYLPGNLLAELRLNIGSKQIARLRRTVRELL